MAFETSLAVAIDSRGARLGASQVNAALDSVKGAAARATTQTTRAFDNLRQSIFSVRGAIASLGLAFGAREFIQAADTFTLLEGRLRIVTSSATELAAVQRTLFETAQETRTAFESTAEIFVRLARFSDELGRSQADLIDVSAAVQKAVIAGGSGAREAAAGVIQLSQALGSGTLRGDEFRSVMENLPRVAQAIAAGLGVTVGQLREISQAGELTAQRVVDSLLSQKEVIDREFSQLPVTVAQAFQQLQNALGQTIFDLNKAEAQTATLVDALNDLRRTVESSEFLNALGSVASFVADTLAFLARNLDLVAIAASAFIGLKLGSSFGIIGSAVGVAAGALAGLVGVFGDFRTQAQRFADDQARVNQILAETATLTDEATAANKRRAEALEAERKAIVDNVRAELARAEANLARFQQFGDQSGNQSSGFLAAQEQVRALQNALFDLTELPRLSQEARIAAQAFDGYAELLRGATKETTTAKLSTAEYRAVLRDLNQEIGRFEDQGEAFLKRQEEARAVIEATRTPLEVYNDEVARLTELHNEAAIGTETFERAVAQAGERLKDATTETAKLVKTTQESNDILKGVFEEVGRSIQRNLGDTFNEMLSGNIRSVQDFASSFIGIIRNMLAQAAAAFVSQRFVLPALGLGGVAGGAGAASAATGGGGFGNLLNFGGSGAFLGGLSNLSGLGGSIAGFLGLGGTGGAAAQAGVLPTAALNNAGTAGLSTGALSAIGGAAAFGLPALLSLASGGSPIQAAGTGLGSLAGFAVGGPIGAAVGGFLANSLLAGVGKDTPKPRAASEIGFRNGSPAVLQVGVQQGGDAAAGRQLGQATVDALTGFADLTGGSFSGDAFGDFAVIQVKQSNSGTKFRLKDDLNKAGDLLSFKTAEEAISRFVVETVEKGLLSGINENTVRVLNERGLEAAVQFEQARVAFTQQIDDTINGPFQATLDGILRAEKAALKQAEEFGIASSRVRQAFDLQFRGVGQDIAGRGGAFFGSLGSGLGGFLDSARLSDLNPGGLQDRLGFARSEFDRISAAARGGDVAAISQLSQAGGNLLQLERQFNASSPAFAAAFENVTGTIQATLGQVEEAQRQFNADLVTAQIEATNNQTVTLKSALDELRDEVRLLRQAQRQR